MLRRRSCRGSQSSKLHSVSYGFIRFGSALSTSASRKGVQLKRHADSAVLTCCPESAPPSLLRQLRYSLSRSGSLLVSFSQTLLSTRRVGQTQSVSSRILSFRLHCARCVRLWCVLAQIPTGKTHNGPPVTSDHKFTIQTAHILVALWSKSFNSLWSLDDRQHRTPRADPSELRLERLAKVQQLESRQLPRPAQFPRRRNLYHANPWLCLFLRVSLTLPLCPQDLRTFSTPNFCHAIQQSTSPPLHSAIHESVSVAPSRLLPCLVSSNFWLPPSSSIVLFPVALPRRARVPWSSVLYVPRRSSRRTSRVASVRPELRPATPAAS